MDDVEVRADLSDAGVEAARSLEMPDGLAELIYLVDAATQYLEFRQWWPLGRYSS